MTRAAGQPEPATTLATGRPGPLRVLIVEDREDDAELLAAELTRSGFAVIWTRVDTYAGLERALDAPLDLVVCDYSLPAMDPFEVLDRLRERAPDVPVIVISGVVDEEVATALFPHGARDMLLKDRLARLGQSVNTVLAVRDLAVAAREADEREKRTASLLCGLVDHAPAAICVLSADGQPLLRNTKYQELERQGLQGCRLAGCPCPPSATEPRVGAVPAPRLPGGGLPTGGEIQVGAATHLWMTFPVEVEDGEVPATGLILLDITQQKATEQNLLAARTALADQAQELLRQNTELLELDQLKTDLVNTVSHELRTPLTSILGYSELLTDQAVAEPGTAAYRMVEMISRNSRRLLRLIDNLLLLARLDGINPASSGEPESGAATDLAELVESTASVIMPSVAAAGLELVIDVAGGLDPVPVDRGHLEQVLTNLLSNAVKFSVAPGTVRLRARQVEHEFVLEVADTGVGMSVDELALIGTRFFRGESARVRQVPGTGLGVSVVQAIVARYGGILEYASTPGKGTTATLRLPVGGPRG